MKPEVLEEYKSLNLFSEYPWIGEIQNNTIPWADHIDYLSSREGRSIFPMGIDKPLTFKKEVLAEWKPYFNKFYSVATDKSITFFMGFQLSNTELLSVTSYSDKKDEIKLNVFYYGTCFGDLYRFLEKYQDFIALPEKERSFGFGGQ